MRPIIIAITIASALAAITGLNMMLNQTSLKSSPVQYAWTAWKMTNGKSYGTNSEETYRYSTFAQNYQQIQNFDAKSHSFTIALNKFADMTFSEFKNVYLGLKAPKTQKMVRSISNITLPESVDWRGKAVTPVKNQGHCGSCWAFSAIGATEGVYAVKNSYIKRFSEQQLVDCAGESYGNHGCKGGNMDSAFDYEVKSGVQEEQTYEYTAKVGTCQQDDSKMAFKISKYQDVPQANNEELMKALSQQPVSVGIDADYYFQLYNDGIYDKWSCGTQLNHGVLAVGYGSDSGKDFYTIKNSWGDSWGEEGYIRFARKSAGVGMCGITENASYPIA